MQNYQLVNSIRVIETKLKDFPNFFLVIQMAFYAFTNDDTFYILFTILIISIIKSYQKWTTYITF